MAAVKKQCFFFFFFCIFCIDLNLHLSSFNVGGFTNDYKFHISVMNTREGQKVPATIFFLFTWVNLYKIGSVYIKYEPLSFMPCNMDSVARLVALRH